MKSRSLNTARVTFWWLAAGVVALAVGLRWVALTARSLWFDEAFSWRFIALFPSQEFFARTAADVHPILYYIALWFWMLPARIATRSVAGGSVAADPELVLLWLRLFSVAGAALTVAGMLWAGRVLFHSRWVGLAAGLFTAVNAFQLQYAWEARMYTLGTALVPLTLVALYKALTAQNRRAAWKSGIGLSLSLGALLHVHYYTLFTWVSLGAAKLVVLLSRMPHGVMRVIRSPAARAAEIGFWASAALFLPWLSVFLVQTKQVQAAFWIPHMNAWSLPNTMARLFWGGLRDIPHAWAVVASGVALLCVVVSLGRGRTLGDVLATASFVGPLALSALASLKTSVYLDRYFLFASLGLLLLFARTLSFLPKHVWRGAVGITALLGIFSVVQFHRSLDFQNQRGARAAAEMLMARAAPAETILVSSSFVYFPMSFHLGCSERGTNCAQGLTVKLAAEDPNFAHFAGAPILNDGETVRPQTFFATGPDRFWVIDTTGFGGSELTVPPAYRRVSEERFTEPFRFQGDLVVRAYAPRLPLVSSF